MANDEELADLPLPQRVVLLNVTHCVETDDRPVHTGEVIRTCRSNEDLLGDRAVGKLGEAEVSRALNRLEARGLVTQDSQTTSPTGKGRPVYRPTVEMETVHAACESDDHLAQMIDTYRDEWD